MPLYVTAAPSSRITKPRNKRPTSLPFAGHSRRKPTAAARKWQLDSEEEDSIFEDRLNDNGLITSLAADLDLRDVAQLLRYVHERMFEDVPERAGMNSTRIAEVLNFRRCLPPIVTVAHVHALTRSPTTTEREIAELVQHGIIRKITIPGRGAGGTALGEGLVLVNSWMQAVLNTPGLCDSLKSKYNELLTKHSTSSKISGELFTTDEASALMRSGLLTSITTPGSSAERYLRPGAATLGTLASLASAGSKAASGSVRAVGGTDAIHIPGGGDRTVQLAHRHGCRASGDFAFSLPSTGPYLRLLTEARAHLMSLLSRTKYREAPKDLLKERWDGGVLTEARAKRSSAPSGVLPGRTKKWKHFFGLRFDWVLEECLGAGLVEVFDTGSVGHAVRAVSS